MNMNLRTQALENVLNDIRYTNPRFYNYMRERMGASTLAGLGASDNTFSDAAADLWGIFKSGLNTAVQTKAEKELLQAKATAELEKAKIAAQQAAADAAKQSALTELAKYQLQQQALQEQAAIDRELADLKTQQITKIAGLAVLLIGGGLLLNSLLKPKGA